MLARLRLLWGISVFWLSLSMLFDGLNTLLLPDYLKDYTSEANQGTILGFVTFISLLLGMIIQPPSGAFSDRHGRMGILALGVLLILFALAGLGMSQNLFFIAGAYFLIQGAASIAQAAQQGFIPDHVPADQRGTASGLKGFMDIGGALLGYIVLSQLPGKTGLLVLGLVLIITFLLTVVLVKEKPRSATISSPPISLTDAFRLDFTQHRTFSWLVASRFLFLLGTYGVGRFLLYFVADRLGIDSDSALEETGGLLAALTLITVIAAPLMGWLSDKAGYLPMMLVGAVISAIGVLLLIMAQSSEQIFLFGSLMAIGSAAFVGANWALTTNYVPENEAARFMALANFGTAGAAAFAGLLGVIVDISGYNALFIAASVAFIGSAAALIPISELRGSINARTTTT